VALVIPGGDLGFSEWDYPPLVDYLTWSGTRGRLFEIEYNGNLDLEFPSILHIPLAAGLTFRQDKYLATTRHARVSPP
jgi:hypothetical protein